MDELKKMAKFTYDALEHERQTITINARAALLETRVSDLLDVYSSVTISRCEADGRYIIQCGNKR